MVALLESQIQSLQHLCQQFGVQQLEVFGSAARGNDFSDSSDLDFVVRFQALPNLRLSEQYFGLKFALEDLLGREVDLLEAEAIQNPYFLKSIEPERVTLYAA